ncbi:putative membrane protein [Burkholderia sp. Ch1-1]|nr:putative membrane protein [Burkholderia sp. Ch1-1]
MPAHSISALHPSADAGGDPAASLPGFDALVCARRRLGVLTIVVVMVVYVGFFSLVAFSGALLGTPLSGWGSVAFLVMFLMFLVAWAITWLYLRHAGRKFAPLEAQVRAALLMRVNGSMQSEGSSK